MRIKTIEKAAAIITLLLFLTATGLTVSAESRRAALPVSIDAIPPSYVPQESAPAQDLININTADLETLCELKGIGPVLAQRIIDFREEYGPFSNIADIIDVSGIGYTTFEKFKDSITV